MTLLDLFAVLLICLTPVDWLSTFIQFLAYRDARREHLKSTALYARVVTGTLLSIGATLAALGATIELLKANVARDLMNDALVIIFLCISFPQVNWLRLYLWDKFGSDS